MASYKWPHWVAFPTSKTAFLGLGQLFMSIHVNFHSGPGESSKRATLVVGSPHKRRIYAKKRPDNSELTDHFHKDHSFDKDLEVLILQSGLTKSESQREHAEDRWICRLQTMKPTGINQKIQQYARDMYMSFSRVSDP